MTTETTTASTRFASIGIDATDLTAFDDTRTNSGDLLLFEKHVEDAWIQSDFWIAAIDMA